MEKSFVLHSGHSSLAVSSLPHLYSACFSFLHGPDSAPTHILYFMPTPFPTELPWVCRYMWEHASVCYLCQCLAHVYVCACGGQRSTMGFMSQELSSLFSPRVSYLLEVHKPQGFAGFYLSSSCWYYKQSVLLCGFWLNYLSAPALNFFIYLFIFSWKALSHCTFAMCRTDCLNHTSHCKVYFQLLKTDLTL